MVIKSLQFLVDLIFKFKIKFKNPEINKILIFDKENSEVNCRILGIKKYGIVHTRKEEICFPILLNLIIRFKLNILNYYIRYIELSNAKIVITFIDNNFIFYQLKKYFKSKIFISVQNGHRMAYGDIFGFLQKNKNIKNLSADMIFTFNKNIANEYKKKISSNFHAIGSLKNNYIKIEKSVKKNRNTLLYISTFRPIMYELLNNKILLDDYEEKFSKKYKYHQRQGINFVLPKLLQKYCLENKLKLIVLGATKYNKEKVFYNNILGKNYKFIEKKDVFSNYKEVDKHQLLVSTYSTLGYEALARGKRICFFSPNISKFEKSYSFGWPYIKKNQGFFYSNKLEYISVKKTLDKVKNINMNLWLKKTLTYKKNIMIYNQANTEIKKFVTKKLKK